MMIRRITVRGMVLSVLAGLAATLPVVSVAVAQEVRMFGGGRGEGGPFGDANAEPPVNSRQLKQYAKTLGLDADQTEAAEALLEGMQTEWDTTARKAREEMDAVREEFQQDRDPSVFMQKMPEIMMKQRQVRSRLEKSFMTDVQSLLSEEQQARWPVVERIYRRDTTMARGRFSGESVDLVKLTEDIKLPEAALSDIRPALDQYEIDLDRALVDRNELINKAQQMVGDGPVAIERAVANPDPELQKLRGQAKEARERVREINQRYARQIAAALPGDLGAKLNAEFTQRSFPEVYRASHTADALEAALAFADLTPEQKQSLSAARESHRAEAERANKAWSEAIEKFESTDEGYAASLAGGFNIRRMNMDEGQPDSPVDAARKARRDVDKKTLESINSVLSDEQRERLPKRRERARGPQALGGAPGGDAGEEGGAPGAINVIRQVTVGPDGQPVEATAIFVGRPGEAPPEGEEPEEIEIETRPAPRRATPRPE